MISNSKIRECLGVKNKEMTDQEIETLKTELYVLAYDLFRIWKSEKIKQKPFAKNR